MVARRQPDDAVADRARPIEGNGRRCGAQQPQLPLSFAAADPTLLELGEILL
jgi:hypothetical protein